MDEKQFKNIVNDLAGFKIIVNSEKDRMKKVSKMAKLGSSLTSEQLVYLTEAKTNLPDKKFMKVLNKFVDTYRAFSLLEQNRIIEEFLKTKGIKVEVLFANSIADIFEAPVFGKKYEKLKKFWESEFTGLKMPDNAKERAVILVNAAVEINVDIAKSEEKISPEEIEAQSLKYGVRKPHLSKAIALKVVEINRGGNVVTEKINEMNENNTELNRVLSVAI